MRPAFPQSPARADGEQKSRDIPMPDDTQKREDNKRIVTEFYKTALFEGDVDKAIRLMAERPTRNTPRSLRTDSTALRTT
jgi:hypothetical protein